MHTLNHSFQRLVRGVAMAATALAAFAVQAAAPGITGPAFDLVAAQGYVSQPDGASIYTWGYGCNSAPVGFAPAAMTGANCPAGSMQLPGPTLIVNEGETVTVKLTNNLPAAAGNTSILFPGFKVSASGGAAGVLAAEAVNGGSVTYSFTADIPGTHSYFSGTQGDLQVEMGLYGALIVLPKAVPVSCGSATVQTPNDIAKTFDRNDPAGKPKDFRLARAAFNHPSACYDREYLFQFAEMDPRIHAQAQAQKDLTCPAGTGSGGCMSIDTEPYHPVYFLINGRSMPDLADPNYSALYPHQPYNGNPHMHPGELTLVRIIGQGRLQHPFHEHANHVRVLARDGNLIVSQSDSSKLAGPLLFTTTTSPGQTLDGIFQWTGKGLNWDVYGHRDLARDGVADATCTPDSNGYHSDPTAANYYEWCGDHAKPLEQKPFGQVGKDGPVTLPDPNILTNGAWYGGSPYLGPEATQRAVGSTPIPPSGTVANSPTGEAGFAYMWHSHNEREITTNNIFPGGMMMMMLIDPWVFFIDESN